MENMKMTTVPGLKKYRTSDRSHIKLPYRLWTKEERAEWERDTVESVNRGREYMAKGDMRSACSVLVHLEGLRAFGITTPAMHDYIREFYDRLG